VARLEPGTLMLWEKPGGAWLWPLKPVGAGHTRLITRLRSRYAWAEPTIVTELILMEIGDPFMMRKPPRHQATSRAARGGTVPPGRNTGGRPKAASRRRR